MAGTNTQLMARVALGRALRRLREETTDLNIKAVAEHLGCDDSLISRVETGKRACSQELFEGMTRLYGVSGQQLEELAELHAATRERGQPWWARYNEIISANYERFLGFEASAADVLEYQVGILPGLLQTERYARSVTSVGFASLGPDQVDGLVEVRGIRKRHRLLDADEPLRCRYVISQAVLHFQVGGPEGHREQLQHLLELSEMETVDLRVIPYEKGADGTQTGAFTIFRFPNPDVPDVAFGESVAGSVLMDDPRDLRRLHRLFSTLADAALPPDKTRDLIARIKED
ncbi:helix-turn-helix transcriptional regulator [Streptomyces sp. CB03238]|uniref:helix-turn-helix domain-containing protein n=1 Tax=Streptomyces sp. CB03238 TaxID=1907777 RepID=UPI000A11F04A|nr:helix-turn-helix transcriptional regulator [Streptomyces sp. CB03238]ORT58146.1 hypothetical protein BKD26_19790 [Streptomyces sp. CB03238]